VPESRVAILISQTFYEHFLCTKVFGTAFLYLLFGFVDFWHKNIGAKAARKMLVKLTTCKFISQLALVQFNGPVFYFDKFW